MFQLIYERPFEEAAQQLFGTSRRADEILDSATFCIAFERDMTRFHDLGDTGSGMLYAYKSRPTPWAPSIVVYFEVSEETGARHLWLLQHG